MVNGVILSEKEIIKLWKQLNITKVTFEFSCGGDCMNDTSIFIEDESGNIENDDISNFFYDKIYQNVPFYENSDGHYQGEFGNVYITLEGNKFNYEKVAQSEFEEEIEEEIEFILTDIETEFINNYVDSFGKNTFGNSEITWIFKKDFILDDKLNDIISRLQYRLEQEAESYNFTTNLELVDTDYIGIRSLNPIEIENNIIKISFNAIGRKYEDSH